MRRALVTALVMGAFALAACSENRTEPFARPEPSPSPSETTFANGGDCPASSDAELPSGAGCVSTTVAGQDALSVYALMNDQARPRSWRIHLSAGDETIDQPLDAGNDFSYPRVVGTSDVDGDGTPEWWVRVVDYTSHGAPWSGLNLFFARDGGLKPLSLEGKPLTINYGGIARLGEGARCEPGRIVLLRAEAKNVRNTRWQVSQRSYRLERGHAVFVGRTEDLLVIRNYNDPDLNPYYRVDCNGFVFPS